MGKAVSSAPAHLSLGQQGEEAAVRYLKGKKCRILARNWRPTGAYHQLELDIVAREGATIVFVEVKTRRQALGEAIFTPEDNFGPAKRAKFARAAALYLTTEALWSQPCRFDLLTVLCDSAGIFTVERQENVIQGAERGALGGGNTPWQPW